MKQKDDSNSAISLFSFQDIITSITGIMFLVVLLLVLIMLTNQQPVTKNQPQSQEQQELQKQLTALQQQIAQLQSSSQLLQDELEKLRNLSPEEIVLRKSQLQNLIMQQRSDLRVLDLQLKSNENRLSEMQKSVQHNNQIIQSQQINIQQLNAELQQKQKELKAQQDLINKRKNLVDYTISSNSSKIAILIEASKDGFQLLRLDNNERKDFRVTGRPLASLQQLLQYVASAKIYNHYFTIAAKPNGFAQAMRLSYELKKLNFERGIEIIPKDSLSIFEEGNL